MVQITVFSGPERRRRWSDEQRPLILAEAFAPGASPTAVTRRHEISTGQLYTWRNKLVVGIPAPGPAPDDENGTCFAEAVLINGEDYPLSGASAAIVVDLPRGRRITNFPSASPALTAATLEALR